MRIAQVAPLYESVPPKLYGGTERVVSYLTEELVRQGHEVTLFASGDSQTSAKLVPACPRALWRDETCRETMPHHVRLMELVFDNISRFDIVHFHCDYLHFPLVRRSSCPSVTTLHGRLHTTDLASFFDEYSEVPLVSISHDQRGPVPAARWEATVYHGLPRTLHTFQPRSGDYLAFLGRVSPEKGLDRAIRIAQRAGMKLKIAAKIYPDEGGYFHQVIEPLLRESKDWVEFIGEVGGKEKDDFLGNAYALLFPIDWPEPFGLVMIESLACGTPVVAWRNGSVPEIIKDGVTGFVVECEEEAVEVLSGVSRLNRQRCRRDFEERFDATRMTQDYLDVYRRLAGQDFHYESLRKPGRVSQPVAARSKAGFDGPSRARATLLGPSNVPAGTTTQAAGPIKRCPK
jgi:glycosyltransferase involved in cell wall biosynthesis